MNGPLWSERAMFFLRLYNQNVYFLPLRRTINFDEDLLRLRVL